MRPLAIALAMLATALVPAAAQAAPSCRLKAADIVSTSPYFSQNMRLVQDGASDSVSFVHNDDPRIAVIFTVVSPDPVGNVSRSDYVAKIEEHAQGVAIRARTAGRQAEHAVYPYDPVGWRTVQQQPVAGIGDAMVAHQEVRITPECLLAADLVSPDSINLRSRLIGLINAVAGVRDSASRYVVPESWQPDRTVPTGYTAIAGGVLLPLAVIALLFGLMKQMMNLDPPGSATRIVQGCAGLVAFGAVFILRGAYLEGAAELKYVDGGILLSLIGIACAIGAISNQRGTLLSLIAIFVGGIATLVATIFRWTPDNLVTSVTGGTLILLGLSGFYAWSEASASARLHRATEAGRRQSVNGAARTA